ncbi:MAG: hypothetical protein KGH60_03315 [Candidatus Micrarchaeota archaeon]|nr:hypothetical protein [Candidatus Micrarchaeota archaeon]
MRKRIRIPFSDQVYSEEYVPLNGSGLIVSEAARRMLTGYEAARLERICNMKRSDRGYHRISGRLGVKVHDLCGDENMAKQFVWMAKMHSILKPHAPSVLSMVYSDGKKKGHDVVQGYLIGHIPGKQMETLGGVASDRALKALVARAVRVINRFHAVNTPHGDYHSQNIMRDRLNTWVIDARPWARRSISGLKSEDAEMFSRDVLGDTNLGKDDLRDIVRKNASHEVAKVFMEQIDMA